MLLAAPAPAAAEAPTGASQADFGVRLLTTSQRAILRRGRLRARVTVPRGMRLRVSALLRRTGTRPKAVRASSTRVLTAESAGSRTFLLRLNTAGKRELKTCRGHRLTITARPAFSRRRKAQASDILRVDHPRCDPGRSGVIIRGGDDPNGDGGGGGGSGGGGSGGDEEDGGRRGGRGEIDVSNANRCDFMDPAACLFPWPNNHFTTTAETPTQRKLNLHRDSMPKNRAGKPIEPDDYNRNDGFSPGQMIVTKVPGLESKRAFERTGAVPITDLDASFDRNQPVVVINARTRKRHLIWSEIDSNPENPEDVNLLIRPGVNFDEGERYIVALRRLRDDHGRFIEAHNGFAVYRDRVSTREPAIEDRRAGMEDMFETLEGARIRRDDLYLAWDFTVASEQNLSERMLSMRDRAFAALGDTNLADLQVEGTAPQYVIRGVQENPSDGIARRVDGSFFVPCYLDTPGCGPGSQFRFSGESNEPQAIPGNVMEARFRCHVPNSATTGPPSRPALYGHGLLGDRAEINQGQLRAFGNEHNIVFCATDWSGMACPDLPDPPGSPGEVQNVVAAIAGGRQAPPSNCDIPTVLAILQDLSNFPKLADRVQQGILSFLYLGRLMVHPQGFNADPAFQYVKDGSPLPQGVLDTSRLFYDGNSQGGIIGGALTAVAVDYDRAVLGVPGMNYSTLLRRSVDFDAYATGQFVDGADTPFGMYDSYPNELERPLMLSMIQILWDRAEANGYAHHMTKDPLPNTPPHEVLLHVGLGDHQVAQVTAEVEARTIGASARAPYADPGRDTDTPHIFGVPPIGAYPFSGSAIVLWDTGPPRTDAEGRCRGTPAPPPENLPPRECEDPHGAPRADPSARVQKSEFMRIGGQVVDVCGPRPCYAGGWTGP